jgi:hypothetical protein
MSEASHSSLLHETGNELTGGFNPLLLWRDRQRILAQPALAARPRPPLGNGPLRFALALGFTPVVVFGWLMSAAVDWLPERSAALDDASRSAFMHVLQAEMPHLSAHDVDRLAAANPPERLPPPSMRLVLDGKTAVFMQPMLTPEGRAERARAWLAKVRAAPLPRQHQDAVIAKVLDTAYDVRRGDAIAGALSRNLQEGGPAAQLLGLLSVVLGAWLFGKTLQGDARFAHAERAGQFYLYYGTSRLFWFLPALTVCYGVGAFASASGDERLMLLSQAVSIAISLGSFIYLLGGSAAMARALAGDQPPARGATWSIGWRLTAALAGASVVLGVLLGIVGMVIGFFAMRG